MGTATSGSFSVRTLDATGATGLLSLRSGYSKSGSSGSIGVSSGLSQNGAGGSLSIVSGSGDEGAGGRIEILSGESASDTGGSVFIVSGASSSSSSGSFSLMTAGAGAATSGVSGSLSLSTGSSNKGTSGSVHLTTGGAVSGTGGSISISVGAGAVGEGGRIVIGGGISSASVGGSVSLASGSSTATSGSFSVRTADTTQSSGMISFKTGGSSAGSSSPILMQTGSCSLTGCGGGDVTLSPGSSDSSSGNIFIAGGDSSDAQGGSVVVRAGNYGSGAGTLRLETSSTNSLTITESLLTLIGDSITMSTQGQFDIDANSLTVDSSSDIVLTAGVDISIDSSGTLEYTATQGIQFQSRVTFSQGFGLAQTRTTDSPYLGGMYIGEVDMATTQSHLYVKCGDTNIYEVSTAYTPRFGGSYVSATVTPTHSTTVPAAVRVSAWVDLARVPVRLNILMTLGKDIGNIADQIETTLQADGYVEVPHIIEFTTTGMSDGGGTCTDMMDPRTGEPWVDEYNYNCQEYFENGWCNSDGEVDPRYNPDAAIYCCDCSGGETNYIQSGDGMYDSTARIPGGNYIYGDGCNTDMTTTLAYVDDMAQGTTSCFSGTTNYYMDAGSFVHATVFSPYGETTVTFFSSYDSAIASGSANHQTFLYSMTTSNGRYRL